MVTKGKTIVFQSNVSLSVFHLKPGIFWDGWIDESCPECMDYTVDSDLIQHMPLLFVIPKQVNLVLHLWGKKKGRSY